MHDLFTCILALKDFATDLTCIPCLPCATHAWLASLLLVVGRNAKIDLRRTMNIPLSQNAYQCLIKEREKLHYKNRKHNNPNKFVKVMKTKR